MSYKDLFSSIDCRRIIFFEDDFSQVPPHKDRVLYDIIRMDKDDRELVLSEFRAKCPELVSSIRAFLDSADSFFDVIGNWNDSVPFGDIRYFFKLVGKQFPEEQAELESLYTAIKEEEISSVYILGEKYGIGITRPDFYNCIFNNYILHENRAKPFRVYTDYSAKDRESFLFDISEATNTNSIVCIIDNQLDKAERAEEIINDIKIENKDDRKNIVGCVFSSKKRFEVIDENVYFEYASKESGNLEACLAKSAYNYYLAELRKETLDSLTTAFDSAQKSKGIAYYLSKKALTEGESEYQIINDWISLLTTNLHKSSENKKHLISLSRVINSLDDSYDAPYESLQDLNTAEAFDYSINEFYLPIAAGDVFTDGKDQWFVLIGQDCDMVRGTGRARKNALCELMRADVCEQYDFKIWDNASDNFSIYNFRKSYEDNSKILQVNYRTRHFIDNEVLDLCAFNKNGSCKIPLKQELGDEQKRLLPQHLIDYFHSLQKFFLSVDAVRQAAKEDFENVVSLKHAPRLISVYNFDEGSDEIDYGLRRVCRLSHNYVLYLYKLYLDYRGRHPFQSINLVRIEEVTLPVYHGETKTDYTCTVQRVPDPKTSNEKNWTWKIDKNEVTRIINLLNLGELEGIDKEMYLESDPKEVDLSGGKKIIIEKAGKRGKPHLKIQDS